MKSHLASIFFACSLLAACGQDSGPSASASSAAASQAAASRLKSYCEQNRADCWFGAQNQARVAQERGQRAPATNLASREPLAPSRGSGAECDDLSAVRGGRAASSNCPLTSARVAVLSRPASDTHFVLLAEHQRDRAPALKFDPNARSESGFKWFAQYLAPGANRVADAGPTATQLSMDARRDDAAAARGYRLRFLDPTAGAER